MVDRSFHHFNNFSYCDPQFIFCYTWLRWVRSCFLFFDRILSKPIFYCVWDIHSINKSPRRQIFPTEVSSSFLRSHRLYLLFFLDSYSNMFCFFSSHFYDKKSNLPIFPLVANSHGSAYPYFCTSTFVNSCNSRLILNNTLQLFFILLFQSYVLSLCCRSFYLLLRWV